MSDNSAADKDWEEAEFRAKGLAELPEQLTEGDVAWAMRQLDVSRATVYRLAKQFREDARTSALLPNTSGPKPGMQPLDPAVEAVVSRLFRDFYATRRKPTKTRFWREVVADCHARGLTPPSIRRLGRWLELKDQARLMVRREGEDKAERRHLATPGVLTANRPLDIVQIDHTKTDVTVVDPVTRQPLGRPTLTVAIDVNTRVVLGSHLSLKPPSLLSVALCLTHAVMDKSHWLAARGINTDWPAHGIPRAIYVDNGAEGLDSSRGQDRNINLVHFAEAGNGGCEPKPTNFCTQRKCLQGEWLLDSTGLIIARSDGYYACLRWLIRVPAHATGVHSFRLLCYGAASTSRNGSGARVA